MLEKYEKRYSSPSLIRPLLLRSSTSFLNYDVFQVGIVSDPSCAVLPLKIENISFLTVQFTYKPELH
jgi:hypothetical protein